MTFATPEAFRASLDARIRATALARGVPISRVRQWLVFDRFLARVFAVFGDRAIAKGGAVLELRLERARTTRDIDLRVTGDPRSILPLLERASAMDGGDFFSFVVKPDPHHPAIGGDGVVYEGQRFRAEARLARKIYGEPRRLFRMTPIHHHFELKGWKENQVITRFWMMSLIFALIGVATLKLR